MYHFFGTDSTCPQSCARRTTAKGDKRLNSLSPFEVRAFNGAHHQEISVPKLRGDPHGDVFVSVFERCCEHKTQTLEELREGAARSMPRQRCTKTEVDRATVKLHECTSAYIRPGVLGRELRGGRTHGRL